MATTSLWHIKGELGKVVRYAENPDKTNNPEYLENRDAAAEQEQWLTDVINYAVQSRKTQCADERTEIVRRFVTGINCMPETAREEMMATKAQFGKPGGIVAYHGYQSFAPDHLHSHFVLNTVSFVNGKKYYRSERDYYLMQKESDALCREYNLSVIEEPKRGKSKHYGEWNAEQNGQQTWRGMVKLDVDTAIRQSITERQFWDNLRKMGYTVKIGKDISVRPPGKERFVRLHRNFGEDYTIDNIRRRILSQIVPEKRIILPAAPPKKLYIKGNIHKTKKITGLRALYLYYLYRMGVLPKKRKSAAKSSKKVYFLFREDIRFIQNISREAQLLAEHKIDNTEQLETHKTEVISQMNVLYNQRKILRYQVRNISDEKKLTEVKSDISTLSKEIIALRREVRLCDDIEKRSVEMREKIRITAENKEKSYRKESKNHEQFR